MITVKINDSNKTFKTECNLIGMIEELNIQSNGIAIAVNNSIVKKSDWSNHKLSENDNVLIIKSTQGG
ncbi:sulfur carrier protein ThiS [Tenacibaculum agarivorans]|uniref:sulfur carrier protein ThiS n=1 Tax=Tenacibaculum agarivorans TaxID=1908389 RepID=UPI00094B9250|nr:sulfur carrier protein ThiS [Tenacibaculum agarivorans]